MKTSVFTIPGFLAGLTLTVLGGIWHGMPGIVAGLMLTVFLMFFIGSIVITQGVFGGLGSLFFSFIGFFVIMVGMYLFEQQVIDGGYDLQHKAANKAYFADRVFDVIGLALKPIDDHFTIGNLILCFIGGAVLGVIYNLFKKS